MLINMKLHCCCFRHTQVISTMDTHTHARTHAIRNRELYIGKTSSLISPNLNNMAGVSIINSCKRHEETVKSLEAGEEQVVNFSVHQHLWVFVSEGGVCHSYGEGWGCEGVELWFCLGGIFVDLHKRAASSKVNCNLPH